MGMFDWYQPAGELNCPVCGQPLREWQGKDDACALFIWREGVKHPVDQQVSDDIRWSDEELLQFALPPTFEIYSYDCPNHQPIDAVCTTEDETWSSTVIQPFKERPRPIPWTKS